MLLNSMCPVTALQPLRHFDSGTATVPETDLSRTEVSWAFCAAERQKRSFLAHDHRATSPRERDISARSQTGKKAVSLLLQLWSALVEVQA